jgi:hypothetical protein
LIYLKATRSSWPSPFYPGECQAEARARRFDGDAVAVEGEQLRRNVEIQRLCGLEVDYQLVSN